MRMWREPGTRQTHQHAKLTSTRADPNHYEAWIQFYKSDQVSVIRM